jgi:hypothetical protein
MGKQAQHMLNAVFLTSSQAFHNPRKAPQPPWPRSHGRLASGL